MSGGIIVLISGRGSNLRAILESPVGRHVSAVISDTPDAGGLQFARTHGKPTHVCLADSKRAFASALAEQITSYAPALIALAGFMRALSADFTAQYAGKIVNIHPSLLPAFRGLHTHRRALAAGAREHGCTVHWVNAKIDDGDIIASEKLTINRGESEETLAARVLALEHRLYPGVLAELLRRTA